MLHLSPHSECLLFLLINTRDTANNAMQVIKQIAIARLLVNKDIPMLTPLTTAKIGTAQQIAQRIAAIPTHDFKPFI